MPYQIGVIADFQTGIERFTQDALGNVTALTNAHGKLVEQYEYDIYGAVTVKNAYGKIKKCMPMTSFAHRGDSFAFTGREYDGETGLYHYRTRAYSPELGRFLQPDSIHFRSEDYNLYRYCRNNPVNMTDPYGLWSCPIPLVHPGASPCPQGSGTLTCSHLIAGPYMEGGRAWCQYDQCVAQGYAVRYIRPGCCLYANDGPQDGVFTVEANP